MNVNLRRKCLGISTKSTSKIDRGGNSFPKDRIRRATQWRGEDGEAGGKRALLKRKLSVNWTDLKEGSRTCNTCR